MDQYIGLDLGYGFVKVTDDEKGYVFPSVVGEGHERAMLRTGLQASDATDDLRIGLDGRIYFVGRLAIRHSRLAYRGLSTDRVEGNDLQALFLAALSFYCTRPVNRFSVVTGLPPGYIHRAGELARRLRGEHRIMLYRDGQAQESIASVDRIEVVPQPLGSFWSRVLDSWGQLRSDSEQYMGRVGIIDIGFKTTDLAAIEEGDFIAEASRTIPIGLASGYDEVAGRLLGEYGLEREAYALDEAMIRGELNVNGRRVDISHIRSEAYQNVATKILVELTSAWRLQEFDHLLLSGGGGQALSAHLLPRLSQGSVIPDSVTANSVGYLAWANRLWRPGAVTGAVSVEGGPGRPASSNSL